MSSSRHIVRVNSSTEERNPRTVEIDTLPSIGVLELLNAEDQRVAEVLERALPSIAVAVDAAVDRYEAGGTMHYFGAGTSGRIGVMDAAEIPPTFSASSDLFVAHHAGGEAAAERAIEAAEDDIGLGHLSAANVGPNDVAIGLTASGRTPYVLGALRTAKEAGAFTVLISSHAEGDIADIVDVHVFLDTGPEAIAGSTRLKAGTAQKLAVNSFSTALMIRVGKTYSNLMVDVAPTNAKLRGRVLGILEEATGADSDESAAALEAAGGDTKTALVSLTTGAAPDEARAALDAADGRVREAVDALGSANPQTKTSTAQETTTN
ncbi:MAG: N-acetylmuramic acid 6-phosphate etherase [Actinomycetota bacterium]